jgi:hypothetical protein
MKIVLILSLVLGICGCCYSPTFGHLAESTQSLYLQKVWFAELPRQYIMKHVVTVNFTRPRPKQLDFLGYMLVKDGSFRLIAMNELGLNLLDIYAEKGADNLVIVRQWEQLGNSEMVKHMAKDIYYTFCSQYEISAQPLREYTTDDHAQIFVASGPNCTWRAWEIKEQHPHKIRCGQQENEIASITYDYTSGVVSGFPQRITIAYPLSGVDVQIQILSLQAKEISDAKFVPTISAK